MLFLFLLLGRNRSGTLDFRVELQFRVFKLGLRRVGTRQSWDWIELELGRVEISEFGQDRVGTRQSCDFRVWTKQSWDFRVGTLDFDV